MKHEQFKTAVQERCRTIRTIVVNAIVALKGFGTTRKMSRKAAQVRRYILRQ
jgi:hypothetical protein